MDLSSLLVQHPIFEGPELKDVASEYINTHECSFGHILPLLRLALSGDIKGPDVFEMMAVLGRGETRHRLYHAEDEFGIQIEHAGTP